MIEIPVGQHPAYAARLAMTRGAVRVPMNHRRRFRPLEQRGDAFGRHVVFERNGTHAAALALCPHVFSERLTPRKWRREKQHLRKTVARESAKQLITAIRGAQTVAMRDRNARA